MDCQFGVCELSVDEGKEYRITIADYYNHIEFNVILHRDELVNVIDALTYLTSMKESSMTKGKIYVIVERISVNNHLVLELSKEDDWSICILFYNEPALSDFLEELETMAAF